MKNVFIKMKKIYSSIKNNNTPNKFSTMFSGPIGKSSYSW